MKLTFMLSLAPRPNIFSLFPFQISWNRVFTILIHPPTPSSPHIPRSNSSLCDIYSDLVDEYVHIDISVVGSSLPPSASDPPSIEHVASSSSSLGSDLMITRAKDYIFKTIGELLWLTHLLHDLKIPITQQPLLFFLAQSHLSQASQTCLII